SIHGMGGYRVQGRGEEAGRTLIDQAQAIEKAGAFSIVLEGVPAELGRQITEGAQIPTIGIGAGPYCDGQVLVVNDLLGLSPRLPKLARAYADLRTAIADAAKAYARDVAEGAFPDEAHTYH
ncbi:MAG TPA: 3-methyl-2-oxobutanoate hydroxymethyltransferase, partial [Actinomycetota bacterium]|nr:3-methyl-2-oxobutanoate hydroxymethyltransferase [Actinomycetota bacterium]